MAKIVFSFEKFKSAMLRLLDAADVGVLTINLAPIIGDNNGHLSQRGAIFVLGFVMATKLVAVFLESFSEK